MFKQLRRVHFRLVPDDPHAGSARAFLQRLTRQASPECQITLELDEDGGPGTSQVEVEFLDKEKRLLRCVEYHEVAILRAIEAKSKDMEMSGILKEIGYDPRAQAAGGGAAAGVRLRSAGPKASLGGDLTSRLAQERQRQQQQQKQQQQQQQQQQHDGRRSLWTMITRHELALPLPPAAQ